MAMDWKAYSDRRKQAWTPQQKRVYEVAAQAFEKELEGHAALGGKLARARNARQLTQAQLEQISGVQQSEISRIERGLANPTVATLDRILAALRFDVELISLDEANVRIS